MGWFAVEGQSSTAELRVPCRAAALCAGLCLHPSAVPGAAVPSSCPVSAPAGPAESHSISAMEGNEGDPPGAHRRRDSHGRRPSREINAGKKDDVIFGGGGESTETLSGTCFASL